VILARLERLREYITILESVQQYDFKRYNEDPLIYSAAERNLHLAIECLLDIGNHIIADKGYERPETYSDVFRILYKNNFISQQMFDNIDGMSAFRNILVHDYLRLDRKRIYQTIQERTRYLEELGSVFTKIL